MPSSSTLILVPVAAAVCATLLHLLALRVFPRFGLLDFPERYGLKRKSIPYPTGILAVIVFCAFYASLEKPSMQSWGLITGILLLAVACFLDDRRQIRPEVRLGVQCLVAVIIFATGTRIYSLTNPLEGILLGKVLSLDSITLGVPYFGTLPVISGLFTIFWLGLTINALNWFDGIPGQVGTLSTIGFLTIGFLSESARVNQPGLALFAFILAGISGAGLIFDFPPPTVVMGDSGAMFFGLMLGVLTIYTGGKVATAFLVLGVPLVDLFIVIVRRLLRGTSPLRGSMSGEHLHHRLLARGWPARRIIILTAAIGTLFGSTALFLDTFQKFIAAGVLFLLMGILALYSKPKKVR